MNNLRTLANVRLLVLSLAACAVAACGQRDQATAVDDSATADQTMAAKVPVTTASDEARAYYEEGLALADNLHFVEANAAFTKAVEADPGFAMAYLQLALTSQSAAAFFKAVGMAEDNIANASVGENLYIRALIAGAENDQAAQLEALNEVLGMYPKDERTHAALANYYFGQQDFPDAIKHFEHATSINPDFASAWNSLGYARRSNGDLAGAREAFEQYVKVIPDEANPYDSYAELLMEMGEYDESIANYRKALEIEPHFLSAYAGIATNESLKGNYQAALAATTEMLNAARTDAEKRGAMFQTVVTHLYAGKIEDALDTAERLYALAHDQDDFAAMGDVSDYMGDIMLVTGDPAQGLEYYDMALKHRLESGINDANKEQARRTHMFKSAIAAIVDDDLETAEARAADYAAATKAGGTAFEQRRVHELAGYIASIKGDAKMSAAELAQANQLDPIVLYWQAVANKDAGNEDKASELANRAAYRNTLSANLPLFRDEAITLLEELENQEEMEAE